MTVYSLTASDEPLQVRYVGRTKRSLNTRLAAHIGQFANPRKMAWIRAVIARGATVDIRALSEHRTLIDAEKAECRWISFWSQYCDLLNGNTPHWRAKTRKTRRPQLSVSSAGLTQEQLDWLILRNLRQSGTVRHNGLSENRASCNV